MKIAITSTGPGMDSLVDERFGRARFLVIVNPETGDFEAVDNLANVQASQGAGVQAAQEVASRGIQWLLTGGVGPKALQALSAGGVLIGTGISGTVRETLDRFKAGGFAPAQKPDAAEPEDKGRFQAPGTRDPEGKAPNDAIPGKRPQRIAVPSMWPGGLEAARSMHFGHCDCFTLVDLEEDGIAGVRVVPNVPHQHGGCLAPVQVLLEHEAQAIVVHGIGMRPLEGFQQAGILVYQGEGAGVKDVIEAFLAREIIAMDESRVCGGGA